MTEKDIFVYRGEELDTSEQNDCPALTVWRIFVDQEAIIDKMYFLKNEL